MELPFADESERRQARTHVVNIVAPRQPDPRNAPVRILVAGSDLLAGALARALETFGFVTRHVMLREAELARGIAWRPNLVLIDVRSVEVTFGLTLISQLRRAGLGVCVIDAAGDGFRRTVWTKAGTSALIDKSEPFDQLFGTISRLLQMDCPPRTAPSSPAGLPVSTAGTQTPQETTCLESLSGLTERERFVLAELMEGHCAEEIAKAAVVSISTVRSQIKAVLQKLGVNSQLAAVAFARRAGWSLENAPTYSPEHSNGPRVRVS